MKKKVILISAIGLAILAGILYFALNKESKNETVDNVSVRMKWFYAGTMTGWFAGVEEGFYKEEGINLQITPGGPDNNAVKLVASGTDAFGVAGSDEVLMAREKGIPVVAIGVLFKDSPLGFVSKKEKGIVSPEMWNGKTIEVSYGSNAEVQYLALKRKFNVINVKEVPYTFNLVPFINGAVDVSVAYLMDQVITLENKGIELNIQSSKEYDINPYGDVIITSEKMIKENPELIKRFMQATIKSVKWAIENKDKAVTYLLRSVPELKYDNELKVWNATIPFLVAQDGVEKICVMSPERWTNAKNILVDFSVVTATCDENKAYTNQFTLLTNAE
jgi:ABC-type nitrate/sulfonate/bicarbonate transport system substrate-binding protein